MFTATLTYKLDSVTSTEVFLLDSFTDRQYAAFEYLFDPSSATLTLNGDVRLDIREMASHLADDWSDTPGSRVLSVVTIPRLPHGDADGINLPWFNEADACLLWANLLLDYTTLDIQLELVDLSSQPETDQREPSEFLHPAILIRGAPSRAPPTRWSTSHGLPPALLTIPLERDDSPPSSYSFIFPRHSGSHSPSRTYRIRLHLQDLMRHGYFIVVALSIVGWYMFHFFLVGGMIWCIVRWFRQPVPKSTADHHNSRIWDETRRRARWTQGVIDDGQLAMGIGKGKRKDASELPL